MNWKRSIALVIGAFCVLASGSFRAAYGAPPNPCSLLTQAQVSAVLGVQVGEGRLVVPKMCEWDASGAPSMNAKKVAITLQDAQAFAYAKMPVGHGMTKTPVSGVGDDAVFGTVPKQATTLTVKKGSVVFVVHVTGFPITESTNLE